MANKSNIARISKALARKPAGDYSSGYGGMISGSFPQAGLPRNPKDFMGAFGPLLPINPFSVDQPEDGNAAQPRRWQYPIGQNVPSFPGSYKLIPFSELKQASILYSVARACIRTRVSEILALERTIIPSPKLAKLVATSRTYRKEFEERKQKILDWFSRPDPNYLSFENWLYALLEQYLSIDAMSLYLHPTDFNMDGPFGSNLQSLDVIDGATIYPLVDITGSRPAPPEPAYQQYLYGVPRTDLMNLPTREQLEDRKFEREFRTSQLLYLPRFTFPDSPYGFSHIEQVYVPITIGMKRQEWRLDYFQVGNVPGTYIVAPENWTPSQVKFLQDALNHYQGTESKWKAIVLPGGSTPTEMKQGVIASDQDMVVYEEVMSGFDMVPSELGFSLKGPEGGGMSGGAEGQPKRDMRKIERIRGVTMWLSSVLFNHVIHNIFNQKDMDWRFDLGEEEERQRMLAQTLKMYVDIGVLARDEAREQIGKDPFGYEMTLKPTLSGFPPAPLWDENGKPVPTQGPNPYNGTPNQPTFGSQSPAPPTQESPTAKKPSSPQPPIARTMVPLITKAKGPKETGQWHILSNGKRVFARDGRLLLHPNHSELTYNEDTLQPGQEVKVNDRKHRNGTYLYQDRIDERESLVFDGNGGEWIVPSRSVVPGQRVLAPDNFYYVHPNELTTADHGAAVSFSDASPYAGYIGQLKKVLPNGRHVLTDVSDKPILRDHLLDVVHGHTEESFNAWNAQYTRLIKPQLDTYDNNRQEIPQDTQVYLRDDPKSTMILLGQNKDTGNVLVQGKDGITQEMKNPDLAQDGIQRRFSIEALMYKEELDKVFPKWKRTLSAETVVAIEEYTKGLTNGYIERLLRNSNAINSIIRTLDRAFTPLPIGVTTHRGVTQEAADALGLNKDFVHNMYYYTREYTSTSLTHDFTTPVVMHIFVPPQAKILPAYILDDTYGEIILPRNSVFRVVKSEEENLPTGKKFHIYVDWLGVTNGSPVTP